MKKLKTLYNQLGPNIIGSIDAAVDVISHGCLREKVKIRMRQRRVDRFAPQNQFESRLLPTGWWTGWDGEEGRGEEAEVRRLTLSIK